MSCASMVVPSCDTITSPLTTVSATPAGTPVLAAVGLLPGHDGAAPPVPAAPVDPPAPPGAAVPPEPAEPPDPPLPPGPPSGAAALPPPHAAAEAATTRTNASRRMAVTPGYPPTNTNG